MNKHNTLGTRTMLHARTGMAGVAFLLLLTGCSAPGFRTPSSLDVDQSLPAEFQYLSPESGVSNGMVSISPGLIRTISQNEKSLSLPADLRALVGKAEPYTIGVSDVVGVFVYDHPELLANAGAVISQQTDPTGINVAPGFIVSANGEISFPYVGRVNLLGKTEIEAADLISKKIAFYIKDPQVTVRIQSFRSKRAYVEGEVRNPGLQIFTDVPMTLAEALSRAGGVSATGDRSYITLTRGESSYRLNLAALQDAGISAAAVPLKNGDIVNVKSRDESKVYVMGEILKPSALLMRNGQLSLAEALGEAGGPNLVTADTGQIYVVRNDSFGIPQIYHLNAKNPAALALADQFKLKPRDVVYVDPVGLVVWNRLVSLILPAAQAANYGSQINSR